MDVPTGAIPPDQASDRTIEIVGDRALDLGLDVIYSDRPENPGIPAVSLGSVTAGTAMEGEYPEPRYRLQNRPPAPRAHAIIPGVAPVTRAVLAPYRNPGAAGNVGQVGAREATTAELVGHPHGELALIAEAAGRNRPADAEQAPALRISTSRDGCKCPPGPRGDDGHESANPALDPGEPVGIVRQELSQGGVAAAAWGDGGQVIGEENEPSTGAISGAHQAHDDRAAAREDRLQALARAARALYQRVMTQVAELGIPAAIFHTEARRQAERFHRQQLAAMHCDRCGRLGARCVCPPDGPAAPSQPSPMTWAVGAMRAADELAARRVA